MKTKKPETLDDLIYGRARKMRLGKALDAYGFEDVKIEILLALARVIYQESPETLENIIDSELDFFLADVK